MLPKALITWILLFFPVALAADVDIVVNPWKSVKISEIPFGIMHEVCLAPITACGFDAYNVICRLLSNLKLFRTLISLAMEVSMRN